MFTNSFAGIPFLIWAIPCLGVATLYYFVWPKPKTGQSRSRWQHLILRWFHLLVWVLLAAACLLWASDSTARLAPSIARLSLLVYLVFLLTLAGERRSKQ